MSDWLTLNAMAALALVIPAAVIDIRQSTIPNGLTYPAILAGLLFGCIGLGQTDCMSAFLGFLLGFVPALFMFSLNGIGGGDVKLLGAVGALFGYSDALPVFVYTIVAGTALAIMILIWRGELFQSLKAFGVMLFSFVAKGPKYIPVTHIHVPFAVAIAGGVIWHLLAGAMQKGIFQ